MKTLQRTLVMLLWCVTLIASHARADTITYFHNDLLGSPAVATNESGTVIWREAYRGYGERIKNEANSTPNKVWYTSRHQDADTGLVYMGARYYDPALGRFLSVDSVGFNEQNVHSFNRYAYAANNPYKFIDPDGREIVFANGVSREFKDKTNAQLASLRTMPTGAAIVSQLEGSARKFVLEEGTTSHAAPDNVNAASNGTGTGGTIQHNPDWTPEVAISGGKQNTPSVIVLGHELSHAADYDRGTLNRLVNPTTGIRKSEEGAVVTENKLRREYNTTRPASDRVGERIGY